MMRNEYPRPDMRRDDWINLNGEWEFAEDYSKSGRARGMSSPDAPDKLFPLKINVPFCRESSLSGLGHTDFCDAVWYRKKILLPEGWKDADGRVFIRIGACDWQTSVWVNGKLCGVHRGGYVSFSFEITKALTAGENLITILAEDDLRSHRQAAGKQSDRYASHGCSYTRTTGIWQTVILERVPKEYIKSFKFYPDVTGGKLGITAFCDAPDGAELAVLAVYEGRTVGTASAFVSGGAAVLTLPLSELHLWEPGEGRLYDIDLSLGGDTVHSYFGMRSVAVKDGFLYINGKRVFQRLVLDQGFYPDGVYPAPDDRELEGDVLRST
ncbi:MAG: beta-galactosidase, partial [Clostridia bacterium]|nr:beta-galactosidase [Clostridia bacterium]